MSLLFLSSCSSKIPYGKWDYETGRWYESKERAEGEFKVLLKRRDCFERLKGKFRVTTSSPSSVILVRLSREELMELSRDECVSYVEFQRPVHPK